MQSRSWPADLPGHQRQRDQAPGIIGAVDVLRDPHAPEDHRALRRREETGDLADRLRGNAAHRRHRLGAVTLDVRLELIEAARAIVDEARRDEPFFDDRVHHRVEQRDVGVRLELQVVRRVPRELRAPRVGEDQLGPGLRRVLDPRRRHRMIDDRVGADQEDDFRLHHVHDRIGDGTRADAFEQRCDARRVAEPRAMVDVVGAEAGTNELLEEVRLLVRTLRRAEACQGSAAVRVADLRERAAGELQRLVPARFAEHGERVRGIHHEVGVLRHPGLRISGLVSRCGCAT